MKKFHLTFLTLVIILSYGQNLLGQQTCIDPHVINSLPFVATGLTTAGIGNDYGPSDACGSPAMENEDYVFSYTPLNNMQINVALKNTQIINGGFLNFADIGLFILDACPDDPTANCVANNVATSNPSIANIDLVGGTTYYIIVSTANNLLGSSTNVNFDIEISKNNDIDLAVSNIIIEPSSCNLTESPISVEISNLGIQDVNSFEISYMVNGGLPVTQIVNELLPSGETAVFDFTTNIEFPSVGLYEITVEVNIIDDENTDNNTLTANRTRFPTYDTPPYVEYFSIGNGYWTAGGTASSWAYGIPEGTIINNPGVYGTQCWVTNLSGNANLNENSYIQSPCYDVSSFYLPTISIGVWTNFAIFGNSAKLLASIDGGLNFDIELYQWTSSTGDWITYTIPAAQLTGANQVIFRLNYIGGMVNGEGIALNYFEVKEATLYDLGITNILKPFTSCNMSSTETVTVEITNFGAMPQSNFPVEYSIDGVNFVQEIINVSIEPGESIIYTFSQTIDLSTPGSYEIIAKTVLNVDEDNSNDEITKNIISQQSIIITDTYEESFENGNAGWYAYGTNSTLELGTPNGTTIVNAADGTNAWVTNLTGLSNIMELSYLESPCFDFSDMVNPVFKASIIYNTNMFVNDFYLEYSLNGETWDTVYAGDASNNWYGTGMIGYGTWGGDSQGWINVKTNLPNLAGESYVKFRFVYNTGSLTMLPPEGVGIDMIIIYDCDVFPVAEFTYTLDGNTVEFQNNSQNADSYLWNFGDNQFLPSTSTDPNPVFTYNLPGNYYVTLTATNDCSSSTYGTFIDISTGNDIYTISGINIFPNPASDNILIEGLKTNQITIIDLNGKTVMNQIITSQTITLNIESMNSGTYFIKTFVDNNPITIKFIKE